MTVAVQPPVRPLDRALVPLSPFTSTLGGCYVRQGGKLVKLSGGADNAVGLRAAAVDGAFRGIAGDPAFPCVGAKSAVNLASYRVGVYDTLGSEDATQGLCRDLWQFGQEFDQVDGNFATFLATFDGPAALDEQTFEDLFWQQLQRLHDADAQLHAWDAAVSSDPADDHFSFSFGGRAFFLVGLHPSASRIARRFPYPAIAFNVHEQFERLREEGKMDRMKQVIRQKDKQLQGEVNPVLRDFGDGSEARQYSGRAVEDDWTAPFTSHPKPAGSRCPFQRLMKWGRS